MKLETNYRRLIDTCIPFINKEEQQILRKAYVILCSEYDGKVFANGEPLLDHIIKLTHVVVSELNLGFISTISTLFSQVNRQNEEVRMFFNSYKLLEASNIINSLNKINNLPTERLISNADNFTGIILSMADDIRAILLSLAENMHLLRFADDIPKVLCDNSIQKAVNIFIPLTHKLGLYRVKSELEELTFKITEPQIYHNLSEHIDAEISRRSGFIQGFIEPIERDLQRMGMSFNIKSRTKSVSSVHNKMKSQKVPFEEIYDLFAVRIILSGSIENEKSDCWKAYSVVTNLYHPEPKRMRDWITRPRSNGYESLHITVREPSGNWVEVQIRTQRMDNNAELGSAAHWKYKGHESALDTGEWLNSIRKILESQDYSEEAFTDSAITQRLPENVIYVFTPAGDLKKMKEGATILDFAFELHTDVGAKCIGGKVNHKIVPIRQKLKNGDMVEIITSKNQSPTIDWLSWVATNRAKNKIKRHLKEAEFKQAEIGKDILRRKISQLKLPYNDENISKLLTHFRFSTSLELFQQLAENKIEPSSIKEVLLSRPRSIEEALPIKAISIPVNRTSENTIIINETAELQGYILAQCCNPVTGDDIFGFIMTGGGVKVHRKTCPNAPRLLGRYPYRVMNAEWSKIADGSHFITTVQISGVDQPGILNSITNLLSNELKMDVRNISLKSKVGKFEGFIKVSVRDSHHIDFLIKKIMEVKGVIRVKRLN